MTIEYTRQCFVYCVAPCTAGSPYGQDSLIDPEDNGRCDSDRRHKRMCATVEYLCGCPRLLIKGEASRRREKVVIDDDEAFETARLLATREGVFAGMSSGAATAGALRIAKNMDSGVVVVILPDRGDRYLSTRLFKSMCGDCPP